MILSLVCTFEKFVHILYFSSKIFSRNYRVSKYIHVESTCFFRREILLSHWKFWLRSIHNKGSFDFLFLLFQKMMGNCEIVISISINGHLKSCARFIIERSEIRKKQHDFKCVHIECRMVLFYTIWRKSRLLSTVLSTFFP